MLKKELGVFLIVGGLTVAVDYVSYLIILSLGVLTVDPAKAASFVSGTLFAYVANKKFTFSHNSPKGNIVLFATIYASTLLVNVLINKFVLVSLSPMALATHIAFLAATGVSASLNFLGMKFLVFKKA